MTHEIDTETCLAQADLLLLLARTLAAPLAWTEAERAVADDDLRDLAERSGLGRIDGGTASLRGAAAAWREVGPEEATAEFYRLFDGTLACPANETMYVRRDKGAVLADIAGFYRAFGFELSDTFREKHDHVVAELQFAALLLILIGRAKDADQHEIARNALVGFLDDHLGVWVLAFTERLAGTTALPLYLAIAGLSYTTWELLRTSLDLSVAADADLSPVDETGTPYECGMCGVKSSPDVSAAEPTVPRRPDP